jgi:hypothetical protein
MMHAKNCVKLPALFAVYLLRTEVHLLHCRAMMTKHPPKDHAKPCALQMPTHEPADLQQPRSRAFQQTTTKNIPRHTMQPRLRLRACPSAAELTVSAGF